MAESTSFKSLCDQVTKEISEKAKLSTDIENIIEQKDISTIPKLIQNKNFTSTSDSELAAIFIKTMIYYIDKKYSSDADKNKKLLKYIKLIQAKKLDLFTVNKILTKLPLRELCTLIEYRYNGISNKAKTILNNLKFDSDESEKEKMEKIDEESYPLTLQQLDKLSKVFENIKNVCKSSYCDDSIFNKDILETILSQCLPVEARMSKPKSIFNKSKPYKKRADLYNEFEYLKKVIRQENEGIDEILEQCHRDAVRKLLTAKRRIENAYKDFIPPKPSHPPPSVPTDGIPDDPPPLRPVTQSTTSTKQKHKPPTSQPPSPPRRVNPNAAQSARTEKKSSASYGQRSKPATANGKHKPPTNPPPKPPRRVNSNTTSTATTEQKSTKTHKPLPMPPRPIRPAPKPPIKSKTAAWQNVSDHPPPHKPLPMPPIRTAQKPRDP